MVTLKNKRQLKHPFQNFKKSKKEHGYDDNDDVDSNNENELKFKFIVKIHPRYLIFILTIKFNLIMNLKHLILKFSSAL